MGLSPLSAPRASTRSQRPSRLAALLPSALAAALALAVAAPAGAQSAPGLDPVVADRDAVRAAANELLGLADSTVFPLAAEGDPGEPVTVVVPVEGVDFTVALTPHSVRSERHYRLIVQGADGRLVDHEPGPVRTVRGSVVGIPGSSVAGSYDASGLMVRLSIPGLPGEYWIEHIGGRVLGARPDDHVVYHAQDIIEGGSCGAEALEREHDREEPGTIGLGGFGSPCSSGLCVAELGCDADVQYYQDFGSSVSSVENRINSIVNSLNVQYENEVGIRHEITAIVVRTAEPDPYSASTLSGLLSNLQGQWSGPLSGTPHDLAELFTGRSLSGGTIGVAWLGGVCNFQRYSVVENLNGFGCATDLSAHELGHNWNANHCSCTGNTMNPFLTCSNNFSTASENVIIAKKLSLDCLEPIGPPVAGIFAQTTFGGIPLDVQFFDASGGAVTSWSWNFGDGNTSNEQNPQHTYTVPGVYDVSLTVSGPSGNDSLTLQEYVEVTPPVITFTDLGGGTIGFIGNQPQLEASGPLTPGTDLQVNLTNAALLAPSLAWISFSSLPVPAFGGTLHPNPPNNQLFFQLGLFGNFNVTVEWPAGVPAGTELYLQFLVQDAEAQEGVALSNGITATVP